MLHGRSITHVAHLHGVPKLHVQRLVRALEVSTPRPPSSHADAQVLVDAAHTFSSRCATRPARPHDRRAEVSYFKTLGELLKAKVGIERTRMGDHHCGDDPNPQRRRDPWTYLGGTLRCGEQLDHLRRAEGKLVTRGLCALAVCDRNFSQSSSLRAVRSACRASGQAFGNSSARGTPCSPEKVVRPLVNARAMVRVQQAARGAVGAKAAVHRSARPGEEGYGGDLRAANKGGGHDGKVLDLGCNIRHRGRVSGGKRR